MFLIAAEPIDVLNNEYLGLACNKGGYCSLETGPFHGCASHAIVPEKIDEKPAFPFGIATCEQVLIVDRGGSVSWIVEALAAVADRARFQCIDLS